MCVQGRRPLPRRPALAVAHPRFPPLALQTQGVLTILRADDAPGGLEVLRSDGSWTPVVIPAGCFVVNLGDLMQRWSNDEWKSTVHRVVNPPLCPGVPTRRQSMAFFHNLNKEAMVECIPSFVRPGAAPKYPPINAFEHLMQRHALSTGHKVA